MIVTLHMPSLLLAARAADGIAAKSTAAAVIAVKKPPALVIWSLRFSQCRSVPLLVGLDRPAVHWQTALRSCPGPRRAETARSYNRGRTGHGSAHESQPECWRR